MTMLPFRQFLFKAHSRCNLSCDYCYVYTSVDQSWRRQPKTMSAATVRAAARRVAEHAAMWGLPSVTVVLHGGEPLLAGRDHLEFVVTTVRSAVDPATEVRFGVQTNGILLDDAMLDLLARLDVRIGISLDGDRAANGHRRFAGGRNSFAAVATAIDRLRRPQYRHLFNGLLATIDVRHDPVAVYDGLLAFEPPAIDLLLPLGNWTNRPPLRDDGDGTPYGDWLVRVFDRWYDTPPAEPTADVRLFSAIMSLILGGRSSVESVGIGAVNYVTVDTDGSIQLSDELKTAADGMPDTGLTVHRDSFDAALAHPGVRARQSGLDGLADACRRCPIVRVCGGGLYASRYRDPDGFRHPSVYCADSRRLIHHIRERMATDLAAIRRGVTPVRNA
jgi:uncharacterized protein